MHISFPSTRYPATSRAPTLDRVLARFARFRESFRRAEAPVFHRSACSDRTASRSKEIRRRLRIKSQPRSMSPATAQFLSSIGVPLLSGRRRRRRWRHGSEGRDHQWFARAEEFWQTGSDRTPTASRGFTLDHRRVVGDVGCRELGNPPARRCTFRSRRARSAGFGSPCGVQSRRRRLSVRFATRFTP